MTEVLTPSPAASREDVTLTDRAVRRISRLLAEDEHKGMMFRVAVNGGGCSGFQYAFTFDDQKTADDRVIAHDGAVVLIDDVSWEYLRGSCVDYVEELIGSRFEIANPNAASTCGCGTSFSVNI
jgi:iron-sulfur cluster assembly accessory protein